MRTSASGRPPVCDKFPPVFVGTLAGFVALLDCAALLSAGYAVAWSYSASSRPVEWSGGVRNLVVVASLLASALLYDKRLGSLVRYARDLDLVRYHLTRFTLVVGGVMVIGGASG